ncbi:MAG: MoxR-like ATPase [Parvibaculaceae bacterium]|jgi:MoxR-like ATPase
MDARDAFHSIEKNLNAAIIGQEELVHFLLIALLANGNVLLEGLPGTAKTRAIKVLASALSADLGRIQFTPDLLPSDVTGTEIYRDEGQGSQLTFQPGPLFNNLVLADEINRAPAKVQSALLEAMGERQVTVAGKTYPLPELFMVLATQNPIEQEGTYPLPEAQMDRFLLKVSLGYPDFEGELKIIALMREEEAGASFVPDTIVTEQAVFDARAQVHTVHVSPNVDHYIAALIMATRDRARQNEKLQNWIEVGSSPRATIALDICARAHAWLGGRDFVDPDDVRAVATAVLRHRLVLTYEALADGVTADDAISELLAHVAVA